MAVSSTELEQLPRFLQSTQHFKAYLEDEFAGDTSFGKGNRFVNAMLQLLPHLVPRI
jgi:hypothetical protein